MNCPYCANAVPANCSTCPSCGAPVEAPPPRVVVNNNNNNNYNNCYGNGQQQVQQKSAFLAVLISCFIVGGGQMYNGQVAKGVVLLLSAVVIGFLTAGIAGSVLWIISMVDAAQIAGKINSGRIVGDWEFF